MATSSHRKLIFSFLILLLGLVVLEVIVRLRFPQFCVCEENIPSDCYNHSGLPNSTYIYPTPGGGRLVFRYDEFGLPNSVRIPIPKPADTYRVGIVGDSFVIELASMADEPSSLRNMMAKWRDKIGARRIEVVYCGQSSYSPLLHIARFKHQINSLGLDAIIYMPDLTDVYDDWVRYRSLAVYDRRGKLVRVSQASDLAATWEWARRWRYDRVPSFLYRLLVKAANRIATRIAHSANKDLDLLGHAREPESKLSERSKQMVAFSVGNIREYFVLLRGAGVHVAVAAYPHLWQLSPSTQPGDGGVPPGQGMNRVYEFGIHQLCKEMGVPFESFHAGFDDLVRHGRKLYYDGDMHFNREGYHLLDQYLWNWILNEPGKAIGVPIEASP